MCDQRAETHKDALTRRFSGNLFGKRGREAESGARFPREYIQPLRAAMFTRGVNDGIVSDESLSAASKEYCIVEGEDFECIEEMRP
jgi:hypothetical protein